MSTRGAGRVYTAYLCRRARVQYAGGGRDGAPARANLIVNPGFGDAANAVLVAAGYNFSLLLRWLSILLRQILRRLPNKLSAQSCLKSGFFAVDYGRGTVRDQFAVSSLPARHRLKTNAYAVNNRRAKNRFGSGDLACLAVSSFVLRELSLRTRPLHHGVAGHASLIGTARVFLLHRRAEMPRH